MTGVQFFQSSTPVDSELGQAPFHAPYKNSATWLKLLKPRARGMRGIHLKNSSYFQAQFLSTKIRAGPKKAVTADAAAILTTSYRLLTDGTTGFQGLGPDYFASRNAACTLEKLAKRISSLGFPIDVRATTA